MYGGLTGRRILITRPRTQGARLEKAITTLGGEVLWVPAIETVPEPPDEASRRILADLGRFAWVAFTSENALKYFLEILETEGVVAPRSLRVASVGPATSRACQEAGLQVLAQPENATGAELGRLLASQFRPAALLLPRSASGREELAAILEGAGWQVQALTCYRTRPAPLTPDQIWRIEQGVDAAVFASPSAATALWEALPETARTVLRGAYCLPIGPTTAKAMEALGLVPGTPPERTTSDGLVDALTRYFSGP